MLKPRGRQPWFVSTVLSVFVSRASFPSPPSDRYYTPDLPIKVHGLGSQTLTYLPYHAPIPLSEDPWGRWLGSSALLRKMGSLGVPIVVALVTSTDNLLYDMANCACSVTVVLITRRQSMIIPT
ncbi:hypothetical protein QBC32DRAFT_160239 [Pseudoneurospora amorphoporcata]|uniref:Uncharacterized protein n=1 Tax=Pseudoneurospora amorphoporcata TaxID=241081 RepID=A0AAN6NT45_9PEZI|nr:hypothetical protein QBC32DRAFT_160239 [Pseudoneurospora amorphoporcata]